MYRVSGTFFISGPSSFITEDIGRGTGLLLLKSSAAGTACLSSEAMMLSVQDLGVGRVCQGYREPPYLKLVLLGKKKKIISKEQADRSAESTNGKGALVHRVLGPDSKSDLKRVFLFGLT